MCYRLEEYAPGEVKETKKKRRESWRAERKEGERMEEHDREVKGEKKKKKHKNLNTTA